MFRGKPLKILWGEPIRAGERSPGEPGSILGIHQGRLWVTCGAGSVFGIERLQKPGRKALVAKVFANGERLEEGERLG